MNKNNIEPIILPALKGIMGNWVYYSCLMSLDQVARRIRYAEEVHKNKSLSDMIQRQLKGKRSNQIAEYIRSQPERFFNALVVATYGGEPNWYALSDIKSRRTNDELRDLDEETIGSVGFLSLRGDEDLFALDGQHRLAGIRKAIQDGLDQDPFDDLSIIFVAHQTTKRGEEKTRRLFTTLNKTARPVSKGDIIALDEDDVMAITARWLIEDTDLFSDHRIAFVATNNIPSTNKLCLTTIGNLYDILTILFVNSKWDLRAPKAELQRVRPKDEELKKFFSYAKSYFDHLRKNFKELEEFFNSPETEEVVRSHRGSHGGSALFRPIGLEIFTRIICHRTREVSLGEAVREAARLPTKLNEIPYVDLMWDESTRTILNSHKVTLREVLLSMLGDSKYSEATLLERYRKETSDENATLPSQV